MQALVALCACLPRTGKCREILELALAVDERPVLARLGPLEDPEAPHGFQQWLESLWMAEDLSQEEQDIIWWQNVVENLRSAIGELKFIEDRLGGTWPLV